MKDLNYRIEKAKVEDKDLVCPVCSSRVWKGFSTKLGKVLVCVNYPTCNYIKQNQDVIVTDYDIRKPF